MRFSPETTKKTYLKKIRRSTSGCGPPSSQILGEIKKLIKRQRTWHAPCSMRKLCILRMFCRF